MHFQIFRPKKFSPKVMYKNKNEKYKIKNIDVCVLKNWQIDK